MHLDLAELSNLLSNNLTITLTIILTILKQYFSANYDQFLKCFSRTLHIYLNSKKHKEVTKTGQSTSPEYVKSKFKK